MTTLHLRVPEIGPVVGTDVETRTVYVEEWIEQLPFADPPAVLRALFDALHALNRAPVPYPDRLDICNLYLRPYGFAVEQLRRPLPASSMGSFEKRAMEADLTRRIATELAYGYKLVIAETAGRRGRSKRRLGHAIQRATGCLAQVLLHAFYTYRPAPAFVWTELGEIFRFARRHGLEQAPAPKAENIAAFALAAQSQYATILTTGLIDPYHLMDGDIWNVYDFVAERSAGIRLSELVPVEKSAGVYVIDPSRDGPPLAYRTVSAPPRESLLLNTRGLLSTLQRRLNEIVDSGDAQRFGSPSEVEYRFTSRILDTLGSPPERLGNREPSRRRVSLTLGLATTHYFLRTRSLCAPAAPAEEIVIGDALPGEHADFSRHTYAAQTWDEINRSDGGIGILRASRPERALAVGDLVGLRGAHDGAEHRWSIGILRWLSIASNGEYRAGIEYLSHRPAHVMVSANSGNTQPEIGIDLAIDDAPAPPATVTLAVPSGRFVPGDTLIIESSAGSRTARIARVRESLVRCDLIEATSGT